MGAVYTTIFLKSDASQELRIIVRLMMAQYKGRNMQRQHQNKTNIDTIVSILSNIFTINQRYYIYVFMA
jgi:hypothetical protein